MGILSAIELSHITSKEMFTSYLAIGLSIAFVVICAVIILVAAMRKQKAKQKEQSDANSQIIKTKRGKVYEIVMKNGRPVARRVVAAEQAPIPEEPAEEEQPVETAEEEQPVEEPAEAVIEDEIPVAGEPIAEPTVEPEAQEEAEGEDEETEDELEEEGEEAEDEVMEIVRTDAEGHEIRVRFVKSFTAKLIQAPDAAKRYYTQLKNALLRYKKVKSRTSWQYDSFNYGRNQLAKLNVRGKTLYLYLALDAADYADTKYKVKASTAKKYAKVPCLYRITNDRRAKYALDLIAAAAAKAELKEGEWPQVDYYMPYEDTESLIARGLIREQTFEVPTEEEEAIEEPIAEEVEEETVLEEQPVEELAEEELVEETPAEEAVEEAIEEPTEEELIEESPAEEAEEPAEEELSAAEETEQPVEELAEEEIAEETPAEEAEEEAIAEEAVEEQPAEEIAEEVAEEELPVEEETAEEEQSAEEIVEEEAAEEIAEEEIVEEAPAEEAEEPKEEATEEEAVEEAPAEETAEEPTEEAAEEEDLSDLADIDEEPMAESTAAEESEQMPEDLTDIDELPLEDLNDIDEEPSLQAEDLADELDIGEEQAAPQEEETTEEVAEEAPEAEETAAEEPAVAEEPAAEEPVAEEPKEEEQEVSIDSNRAVEDLVNAIYNPQTEEEQEQPEAEEETTPEEPVAEEPKEEEQQTTDETPKPKKPQIGGEPLPEGLYDEVPEEEAQPEEQPEEPVAEEPKEEEQAQPAELSEDEKALLAMMQEAEEENQADADAEVAADTKRIDLDTVMNSPKYAAYTQFEKKLIAATDRQRKYYSNIKNTLLLYSRVSFKMANAGESFRQGSKLIARITLNNDKLRLHLCLEPAAYNPRQYHHYSMAKYSAYSEVPFTLEIEDATALSNALKLIGEAMSTKFLFTPNKKWQQVDYAAQYTVDANGDLPPKNN